MINIDHHQGNTGYGAVNWFDQGAAACAEMVFDVIVALGVPLDAGHRHAPLRRHPHRHRVVPLLGDLAARPSTSRASWSKPASTRPRVARTVFDSNTLGRLQAVRRGAERIELEHDGRLAVMRVDHAMTAAAGGTYEDTEGLINLPLTVREIRASAFFKELGPGRVSA